MGDCLRVVAHLASPLAGDAPHLDALLELRASQLYHPKAVEGYKVDRQYACPAQGVIDIPVYRERVGVWQVAHTSSPILGVPASDQHEYVCKRIDVAESLMLDPSERRIVNTTNSWTKSYRLPLRTRRVDRVVWFARGDRREILKALKGIPAVGKKIAHGYGRVLRWEAERVAEDLSWFAASPRGPVLMRPLPKEVRTPAGLLGWRDGFGAATPPYWHGDRYTEIIEPC